MVDREIVATRLGKLRDALRHLQRIATMAPEEYLASETDRALAEHFLRLALEATLDTGNCVIAENGYRKPLHLRDIPLILAENGVLSAELSTRLARATGLRNRLVHAYTEIDHQLIFRVLREDLGDLEAFAQAIGRLVEPK